MIVIDLDIVANKGSVRNLSGKPRGEAARREFNLDAVDARGEQVTIRVPDYIYAISSSYFLGLFSQSVTRYRSAEGFLQHYKFEADDVIMKQVLHGIDRCLAERDAHRPGP